MPKPPLPTTSRLPSPPLFPREFPLLAQSYLEEHQEHDCAKTEGDQRDGEHFAGQPTDQGGADRTSDYQRRGRSKRQDARTGRHHAKVSLRRETEQITVARNQTAGSREQPRSAPTHGSARAQGRRAVLADSPDTVYGWATRAALRPLGRLDSARGEEVSTGSQGATSCCVRTGPAVQGATGTEAPSTSPPGRPTGPGRTRPSCEVTWAMARCEHTKPVDKPRELVLRALDRRVAAWRLISRSR